MCRTCHCLVRVAVERKWRLLDWFELTTSLYSSHSTGSLLDGVDLLLDDGVHWKGRVLREMGLLLLQVLEEHWFAAGAAGS